MSKAVSKPRTFRPWQENQERLEFAEKLGINVSELINELIAPVLRPAIEKKQKKIREVATAPVP